MFQRKSKFCQITKLLTFNRQVGLKPLNLPMTSIQYWTVLKQPLRVLKISDVYDRVHIVCSMVLLALTSYPVCHCNMEKKVEWKRVVHYCIFFSLSSPFWHCTVYSLQFINLFSSRSNIFCSPSCLLSSLYSLSFLLSSVQPLLLDWQPISLGVQPLLLAVWHPQLPVQPLLLAVWHPQLPVQPLLLAVWHPQLPVQCTASPACLTASTACWTDSHACCMASPALCTVYSLSCLLYGVAKRILLEATLHLRYWELQKEIFRRLENF